MADAQQVTALSTTVQQQKTIIDDQTTLIQQTRKEVQDRDQAIKEAKDYIKIKEATEEAMKQHIKALEDQLKAANLSGGTAAHVTGSGQGAPLPSAGTPAAVSTAPPNTTANDSSSTSVSPTASATPTNIDAVSAIAIQQLKRRHKIIPFKLEDDIEAFLRGFEIYCEIDNVSDNEKAGHLLTSLDQKVLSILDRELRPELKNFIAIKQHLLERFQIRKSAGLRRREFGKVKREVGETHEEYYSRLLELANKAFVGHSAQNIDENILDQFVTGNDSKTRSYLLEKDPKTAKEALTLAVSFQAARSYDEAMKDEVVTVSNSDFDRKTDLGRTDGNTARHDDRDDSLNNNNKRHIDDKRVSFKEDDRSSSEGRYRNYDRDRDSSRDRYSDSSRNRYRDNSRDRDRDSSRDRYSDSSRNRYRDNSRDRDRDSSRNRYRDNSRDRDRDSSRDRHRDSSRDRYRDNSRDRYRDGSRERQRDNYRGQRSDNYGDRDNNNERDRNNYRNISSERSQERYNSFPSRGSYNSGRNETGYGNRGTFRFNNANRRGGGFTRQRGGFGDRRLDTRDVTNNHVNARSALQYVTALFNDVEVPMLVDTGSAITLINEEVWKVLKINEPLEPVPFAVSSVNNHQIDILGQKVIRFSLKSKARYRAPRFFYFNVFIARNLSKEAIIGNDFLRCFQASIDTRSAKLTLIKDGVLSAHSLFGRVGTRNVAVAIMEDLTIEPRTEKRVQCALQEELEDGTLVYFEADDNYLSTTQVSIAGVVDETRRGEVTTQFVNPTSDTVIVKGGTIVGHIEPIRSAPECYRRYAKTSNIDWLQKVDVGKSGFTEGEQRSIYNLLLEYEDVFSKSEYDLGRTSLIEHSIEIIGEKPRRCGPRPLNPTMRRELEKQMDDLLKNDLIQPSTSEYACPVVLVKKKDGSIRFCCDFRRLNDATRKDSYPLPRINEIISTLAGAKLFSTMDCKSGYHQLALKPEDAHKTAFTTQYGLYEWKVMPFGLCNAPSSWQRLMDLLMAGLNWHGVLIYLDDVLVFGKDFEEHYSRLREVLSRSQHQAVSKEMSYTTERSYLLGTCHFEWRGKT
jgi:hypothetical protein